MAATDNKTNFYVDVATGSNINGGSSAGTYKETYANVDAIVNGAPPFYRLDNNNGGAGWGTTADGDWICYDTGVNVEFCKVTDITDAGGGDADIIRVEAIAPTTLTDLSAVNVRVGGSWATIDFPLNMIDTTWLNAAGDPITIWIKNGSYPELATVHNAGTVVLVITVEGYNTTEGDGWDFDWDGNLPTMDGGGINNYGIRTSVGGGDAYWIFKHLRVTNSTGEGFKFGTGTDDYVDVIHCKADLNDLFGIRGDNNCTVFRCEVGGNGGDGIRLDNAAAILENDVYANTDIGIYVNGGVVENNQVWDHADTGIYWNTTSTFPLVVRHNTIDGNFDNVFGTGANAASIGIKFAKGTAVESLVEYNLIHNNDVAIHAVAASPKAVSFYNWMGNNNSANVNWPAGEGDSADPTQAVSPGFTNEANADFQPTSSSPANGAAGPTTMPAGLTTTNRAVGAAEPATVASGTIVISSPRKVR